MTSAERPRPTFVGVVLALAAWGVAGWWSASIGGFAWGDEPAADDLRWIVGVLAGMLGGYVLVHVLAHELGHLVASLLLGLPVLGMRVGPLSFGLEHRMAGTAGHVLVDLGRFRRGMAPRMVLMLLAGPAINAALALAAAGYANDPGASVRDRSIAAGVAVIGAYLAVGNLLPLSPVAGVATDGISALRWVLTPGTQRARVELAVDLARLLESKPDGTTAERREHLRAWADDPRPDIATAALAELVAHHVADDPGWRDLERVARFAVRRDVASDVRAAVVGTQALVLAFVYLSSLGPSVQADPESREAGWITHLAELARAAHAGSLPARTALAMARLVHDRPEEARALLIDVTGDHPEVRARALVVRGLAEIELGDRPAAVRLAGDARRLRPQDPFVQVLDAVLAAPVSSRPPEAPRA